MISNNVCLEDSNTSERLLVEQAPMEANPCSSEEGNATRWRNYLYLANICLFQGFRDGGINSSNSCSVLLAEVGVQVDRTNARVESTERDETADGGR